MSVVCQSHDKHQQIFPVQRIHRGLVETKGVLPLEEYLKWLNVWHCLKHV